ncbi:hypothetical protein, partial [Pseudomonas sp. PS02286]|uniref:hypothetical protein n=1 Tax=Pseudomonas sp. PS02286 TaxID=2991442 RepID=UPI00249B057E
REDGAPVDIHVGWRAAFASRLAPTFVYGMPVLACMDMSTRDSRAFYPSGISPLVFLFASCVPIMAAFFAQ